MTPREQHDALRRGVSLAETLTAVTLSLTVLSTAISLVHRVFSQERAAHSAFQFQQCAARVADVFRRDVNDALGGAPLISAGATDGLELSFSGDHEVHYLVRQNVLRRIVRTNGRPTHHDEFLFPSCCAIRLEMTPSQTVQVALLIELQDPSFRAESETLLADVAVPRVLRIEAGFGRDHRWEGNDDD